MDIYLPIANLSRGGPRMGNVQKPMKLQLRLVKDTDETLEVKNTEKPAVKMKSAMASQLSSFADDLDKQIALILNS